MHNHPVSVEHYGECDGRKEYWVFTYADDHTRRVYEAAEAQALMHTMPTLF